ncbi:ABC transporter permease [Nonomuraea muscovyensis]|uniref:ABC-2 type transport system permease protein n=1 Tax=Nonomuraea muscovyensis TaxID=1124761 RepID=A0A7X0C3H4_9ACTN|nr:ABC transporter permease [Nonomuraea muscovyensis]MBB6347818.1 ABC-2 type transport system permease protein [Nonomuraea muscovyensis]MDF2709794.1 type transporter [Nonomuraea muscovyensis]
MIREIGVMTGRNLRISLTVRSLVQLVITPLVFFAGFGIVLAQLLTSRGVPFAQFLPPAIIMMAMGFTTISTAFFIAADRRDGMIDRFRTLPISGLSVLVARLGADAVRCLVPIAVIVAAGYVVGFRFADPLGAAAFVVVAVAFALSFALGAAVIGLRSSEPEAIGSMVFLVTLPVLNLSTVFAPAGVFPGWLQPVVHANPYTAVVDALRGLAAGQAVAWGPPLAWIAGLCAVFGWIAVRAFRRSG